MKGLLATLGVALALALACSPALADEYSYKRTLDFSASAAAAATSISVVGYNGNIHLYADGGPGVRVHAQLAARSADALRALDVQTARQGSTLRVADICPSTRHLLFWDMRDCNIELDVHYPRGMAVSLKSENGNVTVEGSTASVSIANNNGNVEVDGAGGPVTVKNDNGNVEINGATANVSATNAHGNVQATLAKNWRGTAIAMHTSAGNVELRVPAHFAATYTAKVTLGDVSNNADIRNGPVKVTATTTFGDVVISQQ